MATGKAMRRATGCCASLRVSMLSLYPGASPAAIGLRRIALLAAWNAY